MPASEGGIGRSLAYVPLCNGASAVKHIPKNSFLRFRNNVRMTRSNVSMVRNKVRRLGIAFV
jgi:hypothetical protein